MAKQVCKFCKGEVKYGNIFCTVKCARDFAGKQVFHEQQLVENGFEQHPEMPNVYRKGGVAVTLERIHHVGLDKALEHHGHAVTQTEPSTSEASS